MLVINIFVVIGAGILLGIAILADSTNSILRFINGPLKLIAKLSCGFYVGFFSGIIPIYLSELPTKNIRGLCGFLNQVFFLFGSLLCSLIEPYKPTETFPLLTTRGGYQLTIAIASLVFLPLVVHFGLFFLSESPAYLSFKRNQNDKARKGWLLLLFNNI